MTKKEIYRLGNTKSKFFYGYIIVVAAFIIQVVMVGPRISFGVFFKPLLNEFGWTRALISGAYSISTIVQGLSGIVMGSVNDRLGPRGVMILCGLLAGAGFMLMSLTNAAWNLYLIYALIIGIAMGGAFVPLMSTVARWFVKRRSMMTGLVIAGGGTGATIVPPVVNWLISNYEWRNSYIIMGVTALVVIVLASQFLKRDPAQIGQVPYGKDKGEEEGVNLVATGFPFKEVACTKQFWMVVTMLFCFGLCVMTITVHIVPHITDLGISAATAANILAASGAAILIGSIVLGSIADRIGNRQTYIICFILMSAMLLLLVIVRDVWIIYICAVAIGFSSGGCATLEAPLTADLFGMSSHGLILGIFSFCHIIGSAVGPFMAGYMFDVNGNYQLAFSISAAFGVLGIIMAALIRPVKNQDIGI